jgi:DNA-binding CsgD family transcriptional regulator
MPLSTGRVDAALKAAAEAATFGDLVNLAVPPLASALGCSDYLFFRVDERGPVPLSGGLVQLFEAYGRDYAAVDPWWEVKQKFNHSIMLGAKYLDYRAWRRSAAYEYYHQFDIERLLAAHLTSAAHATDGSIELFFVRGGCQADFDDPQLRALERVLPAFQAAGRRCLRAVDAVRAKPILECLVDRVDPRPRLALDSLGRVLWVSPGAERLLHRYLSGRRTLPDALLSPVRRIASFALVPNPPGGEAPAFTAAFDTDDGSRLHADLSIARGSDGQPFVLVEFERAAEAERPFGLTAAEFEVLNALATGLSNAAIARRLFISPETVRTHLYRIYRKLDVGTRTQAVLKLLDAKQP